MRGATDLQAADQETTAYAQLTHRFTTESRPLWHVDRRFKMARSWW